MKDKKEGLKIISAEGTNFMGLKDMTIHIGGQSMTISGKNEIGKSRFFQLLMSGIDPKSVATEVISKGQTKATAKIVIAGRLGGEDLEFTIEVFYSEKNKSGRLVLTDKKGDKVNSPKEVLKNLIGNISFDIHKFLDSPKKDKIKILKELSGVGKEIDILDIERKTIYDDRTYLGKKIDESESVMNNHGLSPEDIDLYSEPLPIDPIQEELNNISTKITDWNRVNTGVKDAVKHIEETLPCDVREAEGNIEYKRNKIIQIREEAAKVIAIIENEIIGFNEVIKSCAEQSAEMGVKLKKGQAWLEKNPEPKANEISERLSKAMLHNEQFNKVTLLAEKQKALLKDKQELQKKSSDIEKIDDKKNKLIANSKLPIKGLSFSEDEVFYNKLPFEENQINTATLLDVGIEIAKALNPGLKVILIRSGSLIDPEHKKRILKKNSEEGYQTISEMVTAGDELDIQFTEEEGE